MNEKTIEQLAALITIAGAIYWLVTMLSEKKACCAKCAGGGRKGFNGFAPAPNACGTGGRPAPLSTTLA